MLNLLTRATLALTVATSCIAQTAEKPTSDRFFSEIPKEEELALANIVEDVAPDPDASKGVALKKDDGSPSYKLYSAALPIPPVAQVKQYVSDPLIHS